MSLGSPFAVLRRNSLPDPFRGVSWSPHEVATGPLLPHPPTLHRPPRPRRTWDWIEIRGDDPPRCPILWDVLRLDSQGDLLSSLPPVLGRSAFLPTHSSSPLDLPVPETVLSRRRDRPPLWFHVREGLRRGALPSGPTEPVGAQSWGRCVSFLARRLLCRVPWVAGSLCPGGRAPTLWRLGLRGAPPTPSLTLPDPPVEVPGPERRKSGCPNSPRCCSQVLV